MTILCFGQRQSQWSYFQGQKIISILHRPYFGSPCISVSSKTGLFWFHCQWFWTPYGSPILEIYIIMLVEFVFYGQCSGEAWNTYIPTFQVSQQSFTFFLTPPSILGNVTNFAFLRLPLPEYHGNLKCNFNNFQEGFFC